MLNVCEWDVHIEVQEQFKSAEVQLLKAFERLGSWIARFYVSIENSVSWRVREILREFWALTSAEMPLDAAVALNATEVLLKEYERKEWKGFWQHGKV